MKPRKGLTPVMATKKLGVGKENAFFQKDLFKPSLFFLQIAFYMFDLGQGNCFRNIGIMD
jgi:hypothetical protein